MSYQKVGYYYYYYYTIEYQVQKEPQGSFGRRGHCGLIWL